MNDHSNCNFYSENFICCMKMKIESCFWKNCNIGDFHNKHFKSNYYVTSYFHLASRIIRLSVKNGLSCETERLRSVLSGTPRDGKSVYFLMIPYDFSARHFLRFKVHYFCMKEDKNILSSFTIILLPAGTLLSLEILPRNTSNFGKHLSLEPSK